MSQEQGGQTNPLPTNKDRKIYWGVVTPKGEPNSKSTYYFQECQLKQLSKEIVGLPVKISHNHVLKNGKTSPPAGVVLYGHVHSKTGQVWAGFVRSDNLTGELAGTLLGEDESLPPDYRMGELSLGFDIITDQATGVPIGHTVKELSICYAGARPGCQIKGSTPYSTLTEKPGPPPPTYNLKKTSEIINKYIQQEKNNNNKKKKHQEKEKMEDLPALPKETPTPRPDDAQGIEDVLNRLQNAAAPAAASQGGFHVVPAKASASYPPQQMMMEQQGETHPIQETLERAINTRVTQKRPNDDGRPQQQTVDKRYRLDFSKYINGADAEWKEPALPEGLNEAQQLAFKEAYAGQKALFEKNQQLAREERRKLLSRLQGASDNFIPTYIEQCASDDKDADKSALEVMMVAPLEATPAIASKVIEFIEAQAKQGLEIQSLRKDINQLEAEYQEKLRENAELKKNQSRPPLAPPQQQQQQQRPVVNNNYESTIPATASVVGAMNLKDMRPIQRIVTQASLLANQRAPNLEGNKLPLALIQSNALRMQALFDKISPGGGKEAEW